MHSFFRGTSHDQDSRFENKNKKLKESMKFPSVYRLKVDMKKVSLDVMKPWMAQRISELLEMEDDVVVGLAVNILEEWVQKGNSDPRDLQIQLQGFLASKSPIFVGELWKLLASASESPAGIPAELLAQYQTRNECTEEVKASPPPLPPPRGERPPSPAPPTQPGKHVANGGNQRSKDVHDQSRQRHRRGSGRHRSPSRGNSRRRPSHRSRSRSASRSRSSLQKRRHSGVKRDSDTRRGRSRHRSKSRRRSRSLRSRSRSRKRSRSRQQRLRSRRSRSRRSRSRRSRSRRSRSRRPRSRRPRSRSRSQSSDRHRSSRRQRSSRAKRSRSRSDSRARRRRRRRGYRSRSPSAKSSASASDTTGPQQVDEAKRLAERELREKALRSVVVNATKKKLGEKAGHSNADKSA